MKITIASLFLAIAGLAAASPVIVPDSDFNIEFEPGHTKLDVDEPCNEPGRVDCSISDGEREPHLLVCVDRYNNGKGPRWEIQTTCPWGQTCHVDPKKNHGGCRPY